MGFEALLETFTLSARGCVLPLTDELSLSGAATTLYCCLKAPPSDCYHFFQDCSACPNRLPQANDDQAFQKLCARRLRAKKYQVNRACGMLCVLHRGRAAPAQ